MAHTSELKLHFLDYWRVVSNRRALIALIFCLVMGAAAIATYLTPKTYRATAKMEVKSDMRALELLQPGQRAPSYDQIFLNTQLENVRAKDVLYPVIDRLGLGERWGRQENYESGAYPREITYAKLRRMINLEQKRNTAHIELQVDSRSREEAVELCTLIASAYAEGRLRSETQAGDSGIEKAEEEIKKLQDTRLAALREVERLRQELGIMEMVGFGGERSTESASMNEGIIQKMKNDLNDAQTEVVLREKRYESLKDLGTSDFVNALGPLGLQVSDVVQLQSQTLTAEAELAALRKQGYGDAHTKVASASALAAKLRQQLEGQVAGIRRAVKLDAETAAAKATDLANKLADAEKAALAEQKRYGVYREAKRRFEETDKQYQDLSAKVTSKRIEQQVPRIPVELRDPAEALPWPVKPRWGLNMAIATLVGLILGIATAFFVEYLDTSVKSMDDIERQVGLPVLAVIPKGVPPLNRDVADSPHAEGYRILRTKIEFARKDDSMNTLTLISGGPGEGKSTTLFNLAWVCALSGMRTLVVDADLRRPTMHHILGAKNESGLADLLLGNPPLEQCLQPTPLENLHFMPSGENAVKAIGFLNSARMLEIIADLKSRYDWVFFDSPPILGVSDAAVLARELDCTAMVVQHRRYPLNISLRVKQAVLDVGGNLLGVVMNQVDTTEDATYGYYNSYYTYYNEKGNKVRRKRKQDAAGGPARGKQAPSTVHRNGDAEDY